jgi:hypothetical protein
VSNRSSGHRDRALRPEATTFRVVRWFGEPIQDDVCERPCSPRHDRRPRCAPIHLRLTFVELGPAGNRRTVDRFGPLVWTCIAPALPWRLRNRRSDDQLRQHPKRPVGHSQPDDAGGWPRCSAVGGQRSRAERWLSMTEQCVATFDQSVERRDDLPSGGFNRWRAVLLAAPAARCS